MNGLTETLGEEFSVPITDFAAYHPSQECCSPPLNVTLGRGGVQGQGKPPF